jgi:hypothetical protein
MTGQTPVLHVNGLAVYTPDVLPLYIIPALDMELTLRGPLADRVLHSITYSPRAVALATTHSSVPKSWRWVSFKGIRLAVPRRWTVNRAAHAPICANDLRLSRPGVTLASRAALPASCPAPTLTSVPPVAGVEVDGFSATAVAGGSSPSPSTCLPTRRINNLAVCIQAQPVFGVLIVSVSGHAMAPATIQIGLFGNGITDRTILDSLRRA